MALTKAHNRMIEGAAVNVKDFGAVGDGVTDDTAAIQAAIDEANSLGILDVFLSTKHLISSSIKIPAGITVKGQGRNCFIYPSSSGSYTGGFMFLLNSINGTDPVIAYPNTITGGIENIELRNGDTAGTPILATLRGIKGFGSCQIKNIRGRNMTQMVVRGASGYYSDNFVVHDIFCEPVIGAEYLVTLDGLGDGADIARLHFPFNALNPSGTPLGLEINNSFGINVTGCIGGNVLVKRSKASFVACHYEKAQFTVNNANVDVRSCFFGGNTAVPMILQNTDSVDCQVTLDSVEFAYLDGVLEWDGQDINVSNNVTLTVSNSYRKYSDASDISKSQLHGLTIANASSIGISNWNNYSYILSRSGRILRGNFVDLSFSVNITSNSFQGISGLTTSSATTWNETSDTYYYHAQYITDSGRAVGRTGTNGESSVALTNGGNGALFTLQLNNKPCEAILRVYRGTSTGSYDKYVDIPLYSGALFYDSGSHLNGFEWVSRGAAGVGTLNGIGDAHYTRNGDRVVMIASAPPSSGTWLQGDKIYRAAPSAGGTMGWVCTTAGTAGTWKTFGAISA